MIKYVQEEDKYYLEIPSFNNLRKKKYEYIKNINDIQIKEDYYKAVVDFFDWYISYCNSNVKKKYSDDNISQTIFLINLSNQNHWIEYLCKSIFVSRDYVDYLKSTITSSNISNYEHTISSLMIDLEWLIAQYEKFCKKSAPNIWLYTGRRKDLNPIDIYSAARTLFYIEEIASIQDLYLRDLKPVVMFQIRQIIELFGKNIIGYYSIESNNQPVKKFTQVAWEFINIECKKINSRINLPFDIKIITSLNSWSNDFVHTAYLHNSYVQFFALKILNSLFSSKTNGISIYDGTNVRKLDIADITITDYNSLKNDFQDYLSNMMPGIIVKWMPTDAVGAYIINE